MTLTLSYSLFHLFALLYVCKEYGWIIGSIFGLFPLSDVLFESTVNSSFLQQPEWFQYGLSVSWFIFLLWLRFIDTSPGTWLSWCCQILFFFHGSQIAHEWGHHPNSWKQWYSEWMWTFLGIGWWKVDHLSQPFCVSSSSYESSPSMICFLRSRWKSKQQTGLPFPRITLFFSVLSFLVWIIGCRIWWSSTHSFPKYLFLVGWHSSVNVMAILLWEIWQFVCWKYNHSLLATSTMNGWSSSIFWIFTPFEKEMEMKPPLLMSIHFCPWVKTLGSEESESSFVLPSAWLMVKTIVTEGIQRYIVEDVELKKDS